MKRQVLKMAGYLALVGALMLGGAVPASALAILTFDRVGIEGGIFAYSGTLGTPVTATGILIDTVTATGTLPGTEGVYSCVGCVLSFTSGGSTFDSATVWAWGAGGTITLTGAVTGIVGATTLLSGTFEGMVGLLTTGGLGLTGGGTDTKDSTLAAFFGLPAGGWSFTVSDLLVDVGVTPETFAFAGTGAESDVTDLTSSPPQESSAPGTLLLLGAGLLGLGTVARLRSRRA
jgi:hypothetical protein